MLGRGIFGKKIPVLRLNFIVSGLVYFENTPPKHDISVQYSTPRHA